MVRRMINSFVAIDLETTGFSPYYNKIIEIGAVKYINGEKIGVFDMLIDPEEEISEIITGVTGITNEMVKGKPVINEVIDSLLDFLGDSILLGHNIIFDYRFIAKAAKDVGINYNARGIDTYKVSRRCIKDIDSRSLEYLCEYFNIEAIHHRALADADSARQVYCKLCEINDSENDDEQLNFVYKKDSPITEKQINFLKSLIKRYNIDIDKNIEDLTKSQASKMIDNILSTYGIAGKTGR